MKLSDNIKTGYSSPAPSRPAPGNPSSSSFAGPEDKFTPSSSEASKSSSQAISPKYQFTKGNYTEPLENCDKSMEKIEQMITGADKSVQLEMYRLGHPKLVSLLADQAKNGVKVQVLLDPTPGYDEKDKQDQKEIQKYLTSCGVEVLKYPIERYDKIDHVKMLIVDGKSLLIGGMNWDKHSPMNQDSNIFARGPVVGDALDIFQNDWNISGGENISGLKSPGKQPDANSEIRLLTTEEDRNDIDTALQQNIKGAKKSIHMEAFALADKETIKNLIDAKGRGVDVKVLLDPNKKVFFQNLKSAKILNEAGIDVRWFDVDTNKKEKLHSKLAVFDEETTFIGSCNFTHAGLDINHEANAEVNSKDVGKAFTKMFDEHWEKKSCKETPNHPDFNEKIPNDKPKNLIGKTVYKYFTKVFHPGSNRVWAGNKKNAVIAAIDKYDKTDKPAPVEGLKKSGENISPDLAREFETIGDLASLIGDIPEFKIKPQPGEDTTIYEERVKVSKESAANLSQKVPDLVGDMLGSIEDKGLKSLISDAFKKAPKGYYKAASGNRGNEKPADEVDPDIVLAGDTDENGEYKGGGLVLHSRRVQALSESLCKHYGITGKEKDEILTASAMHDLMQCVKMKDMKEAMAQGGDIPWNKKSNNYPEVASEWVKMLDKSEGCKMTEGVRDLMLKCSESAERPEKNPPKNMSEFILSLSNYVVSQSNFYLDVQ